MAYGIVNVPGVSQEEVVAAKNSFFGGCETSGSVAAKTVTVDSDFELRDGVEVTVYFDQLNSASNVTLNVNETGAKPVYYQNKPIPVGQNLDTSFNYYIQAGNVYKFVYVAGLERWYLVTSPVHEDVEIAKLATKLLNALTIKGNGATLGMFDGSKGVNVELDPSKIGAASYEKGRWTPKIRFKTSSSGWSNITPSGGVGSYVKIGKIVFIWMYLKNLDSGAWSSYNNDLLFLEGTPFPYQFYEDEVYASRGQLTWRYEGNITDIKRNSVPKGIYTTSQVVYSTDNIFTFSAEIDQYINAISADAKVMLSGWYVAAS